jgi:hypothetical protein
VLLATHPIPAVADSTLPSGEAVYRASTDEPLAFNVPAQPLATAIETFAAVSGLQVLYSTRLVAARQSTELVGVLTRQAALRVLLKDTGLTVRYAAPNALVIVAEPTERAATPSAIGEVALQGASTEQRRYYAVIQAAMRRAFCSNATTRSGRFRVAVSFRVDKAGAVSSFELLSSTGDRILNDAIEDVMRHIVIGEPPSSTMPQPFTTIVVPQSTGADCRQ